MDFMTIKQASEKWGICTRRVQTLCTEGRIDGAERLGHQWVIPINAEKPKDARIKSGRYIKNKNPEMERTKMERKPYSAGAVKFSFWFMEFRKTVQLLSEVRALQTLKS